MSNLVNQSHLVTNPQPLAKHTGRSPNEPGEWREPPGPEGAAPRLRDQIALLRFELDAGQTNAGESVVLFEEIKAALPPVMHSKLIDLCNLHSLQLAETGERNFSLGFRFARQPETLIFEDR